MNKKYFILLTAIFIFIGVSFYIGRYIGLTMTDKNEVTQVYYNDNEQKIKRLLSLIDNRYICTVDTNSIVDNTIECILSNLDPHSSYVPKREVVKAESQLKGRLIGIGVEYRLIDDAIVITRVLDSSPNKNILLAGDRIIGVKAKENASEVKDPHRIKNQLKNQAQGNIFLTIVRKNTEKPFSISVKKQEIPLESVEAAYMLNDSLGYIKLGRFADRSFEEFQQALSKLKSLGMNSLIFDLRDNPGGRVDIARNIADEFLEKDQLVVFTKQRDGQNQYYYATARGHFKKGPLYVLLNERSASASEIVAGALQDNDRATVVGRPSFGKGLIQQEINLGDGSLVRLTIAQYFTPVGRSIQRDRSAESDGLESDGETSLPENVDLPDSLKFTTPKGKTVLGGGGIIPDVLVSTKTAQMKNRLDEAVASDFLNDLAFNYIDTHRTTLNQYTAQEFIDRFDAKPIIKKTLFYLKKDKAFTRTDQETLAILLKGLLARQLFGRETFYKILNQQDPMIIKILNLKNFNKL